MSSTRELLGSQWSNPSDIFSLLLIIGGDVVQKALAQATDAHFSPVCFSFGWVAFSFSSIISMIGEGHLMPENDYSCKIINLKNGYARDCRSWVVGRLLADDTATMLEQTKGITVRAAVKTQAGLIITVHDWTARPKRPLFHRGKLWTVLVMVVQLGIAAIPWGIYDDWGAFLVTAVGSLLAIITAALPQWTIEKYACRRNSKKNIAITKGNGSNHIMIVRTFGDGFDLEDLATFQSPRSGRVWESSSFFVKAINQEQTSDTKDIQRVGSAPSSNVRSKMYAGLPAGFWLTRAASMVLCLAWVALLITATGLKMNTWYLVAVGAIGMFQNAVSASLPCTPARRGFNIKLTDIFIGRKVMDVLMDLEACHSGLGKHLLEEFFPGQLRHNESSWWKGDREEYESKREQEASFRGLPGSSRLSNAHHGDGANSAKSLGPAHPA